MTARLDEALEVLLGWRPGRPGARAATMADLDALKAVLSGQLFDFDERQGGRALRVAASAQVSLQACWQTLTTSATTDTVWTFPRPFRDADVVVLGSLPRVTGANLTQAPDRRLVQEGPTPTSVRLAVLEASARVAAQVDLFAFGTGSRK